MINLIGINNFKKYIFNDKQIYLIGETHDKFNSNTNTNYLSIEALFELIMYDNKDKKIDLFFEGPGKIGSNYNTNTIRYFDKIKHFKHYNIYPYPNVANIFESYLYGLYKNYLKTVNEKYNSIIFHDKYDSNNFINDFKNNFIAKSNFHNNFNFHLCDYRANNLFKEGVNINDKKPEIICKGNIIDYDPFADITHMIELKLVELDENGNYETIFNKMLNKLNDRALGILNDFIEKNYSSMINSSSSSFDKTIMDFVVLIKLLFYLSNDYRSDITDLEKESDVIIIYGGDLHIYLYAQFLEILQDTKLIVSLYKSNNVITIDPNILFSNNYSEYISNLSKLYINNLVYCEYNIKELDVEYLNIFTKGKDISTDINYVKTQIDNINLSKDKCTEILFLFLNNLSNDKLININELNAGIIDYIVEIDEIKKNMIDKSVVILLVLYKLFTLSIKDLLYYVNNHIDTIYNIKEYNSYTTKFNDLCKILQDNSYPNKYLKFLQKIDIILNYDETLAKNNNIDFNIITKINKELKDLKKDNQIRINFRSPYSDIINLLIMSNYIIVGGKNYSMSELEAIEFDVFTNMSEDIKLYINTLNNKQLYINTLNDAIYVPSKISVFGGGNINIILILLIVTILIYLIFTIYEKNNNYDKYICSNAIIYRDNYLKDYIYYR